MANLVDRHGVMPTATQGPLPSLRILVWLFACMGLSAPAHAFPHVVARGETLAAIAERFYGQVQLERLLVAANALDAQGGSPIVSGMRIEVPALSYRRVQAGETWESLAATWLGSKDRADVLSFANDSKPWLLPDEGAQILLPYNLRVVVTERDTIVSLAYRFLGDKNRAWVLDRYNQLNGRALLRGDVVLIPLTEIPLTEAGVRAATLGASAQCQEGASQKLQTQRAVGNELPALLSDVRAARYVEAVARGVRFLAQGELGRHQLATIHRQLLEAYAALGAAGLAAEACEGWLAHDPKAKLDPRILSPKLLHACRHSQGPTKSEGAAPTTAPAKGTRP